MLRHGIEMLGLKQPLKLAEFKPALVINPDILTRLRRPTACGWSGRSVTACTTRTASISCLFLNGVPVATVELKTDFTQSLGDAIDQYRFDRLAANPRAKAPEPLLTFPQRRARPFRGQQRRGGHMVTQAWKVRPPVFLPFNLGDTTGVQGQPGESGGRTPHGVSLGDRCGRVIGWLEILGRYLHRPAQQEEANRPKIIFPRYHQLDVTRDIADRCAPGTDRAASISIQHSAGSGKTNSIAWTAHFFADLHDAQAQEGLRHGASGLRSHGDRFTAAGGAV